MTSSNPTAGGACTGAGVSPKAIDYILGITKAYITRVGEGPLPTEMLGELEETIRDKGAEFGASTGRPRRCGWFDSVVVRYAKRINGLDALAITKLDVLDSLDEIQVCTHYDYRGETNRGLSRRALHARRSASPSTGPFPGGRAPTAGVDRVEGPPGQREAPTWRHSRSSAAPPSRWSPPGPTARPPSWTWARRRPGSIVRQSWLG